MFLEHYGNAAVRALNKISAAHHHETGVLRKRSFLLLCGADQDAAFEAEAAEFTAEEIGVRDACNEVPILDPSAITRAAHYDEAYDLDTDLTVTQFLKSARSNGAVIYTNTKVTACAKSRDGWRVTTSNQTFAAKQIVNAAGAWADEIGLLAGAAPLGLTAYRRSMARIAAPGGHDTRNWPFFCGVAETWYAKPDAGALLVSPAEEHAIPASDAWPDELVLAEGLERYQAFVTPQVTRPIATWAGLRTFAPDRALAIGADPEIANFWWLAGQGGYGFQTAPAAAKLLSDLTNGSTPDLPPFVCATLDVARFAR